MSDKPRLGMTVREAWSATLELADVLRRGSTPARESAEAELRAVLGAGEADVVLEAISRAPAHERTVQTVAAITLAKCGVNSEMIASDGLAAAMRLTRARGPYMTASDAELDAEEVARLIVTFDLRGLAVQMVPTVIRSIRENATA